MRREQVDVMLVPQVCHSQRRDMPHATTEWATKGATIAPVRSRTTPPSSLQAILLPEVMFKGKVYSSLQKFRPKMSQRKRRAYDCLVPPMNQLLRWTPADGSAVSKAPIARRRRDRLSKLRKGQSKDWCFGATLYLDNVGAWFSNGDLAPLRLAHLWQLSV